MPKPMQLLRRPFRNQTALWFFAGCLLAPGAGQAASFTLSPNSISNTYAGAVTLHVSGLTADDTVVVQKYLDLNGNGAVDAGDVLIQQFRLTDGQASLFYDGATAVTNLNVPSDTDGAADGQITAKLHPSFDFSQIFVGKYLFVMSSPAGHFSPSTNSFTVTNFPFAQTISGIVVSNTAPLPGAVVILVQVSGNNANPVAGVVANGSGAYSIKVPPGTYGLVPFASNYVADFATAPIVTLNPGGTATTNVSVVNATVSISGKAVDANNSSIGLGGMSLSAQSADRSLIALAITDTNGNFTAGVTPNEWKVGGNEESLVVKGYVSTQGKLKVSTTNGSVSGVTISLPKATAVFYGTVKDNLGNPLPGVAIYSSDYNGNYQSDGYSDANGNYVAEAVGGVSGDQWQVEFDYGGPANYIYSQGQYGVTLTNGQAYHWNFTGILATNHITGHVQQSNGSPIAVVQVYAYANIGGQSYQTQADTDSSGNYSLNVANGDWSVSVNCQGGSDSLDGILGSGNYQCPNSQSVTIANNNGSANFTVQPCNGVQITTASPLPAGQVGNYYSLQFQASSCNGNFTWSVNDPQDVPPGLTLYSGGAFNGTPGASGTFNFSVHVSDGNGNSTNQNFSLTIAGSPLQVTTTFLPGGTNGQFYSQQLQASGGQTPYSWSLAPYSATLPPDLSLGTNGVISGILATNGTFSFYARVTDSGAHTADSSVLSLTVANPPLKVTTLSLPNGTVGVAYSSQLAATGGQPPYSWSLAAGSAALPPGLALNSAGLLYGTPVTNGTFGFIVQATDAGFSSAMQPLGLTIISSKPSLSSPTWRANQFQMLLSSVVAGQNYTVQTSTNLGTANWVTRFVTNAPSSSFTITDPNATNRSTLFYRVQVGP